ncbi:MAG: ABC transporter permease [Candidatus Hydrogenedens sp.]|nr:ABC transporter permease [Candidatus Hydrogenedens sp.]
MLQYIWKRLLLLIPVVLGVSLFIFLAVNAASGDYVDSLNTDDMTKEEIIAIRAHYGLDKPLLVRYGHYMLDLLHGNLGKSYSTGLPVFEMFMSKIGNTLYLTIGASLVCWILAIPLGIFAAQHQGTIFDNAASVLGVLGLSIPNFWLGLVLIIVFAQYLRILPSGGAETAASVILPAITLGTGQMAVLMRTTRSTMVDCLSQDYLRTARAKGVAEKRVINLHALRNALIPIINITLTQFAASLAGAALTETVFSWPGVGKMIIDGINQRDTPVVCGSLILKCIIISLTMLLIDLLFVAVDPRVRTSFVTVKGGKKENV